MTDTIESLLGSFPVVVDIAIRWGDMDAFGHVNNTVYFQYFEIARIAYLERLKPKGFLTRAKVGPILASTQCRFRFPLTYPDTISVGVTTSEILENRFVQKYAVVSNVHERLAAEGEAVIVTFDYTQGRKVPVPDELKGEIARLEKNGRKDASV